MASVNTRLDLLATISDVTPEDIAAVVRRALRTRGTTAFRAAREAGLPDNAIRYLLEGRDSSISRLAQICDALGLEFYVGRPRTDLGDGPILRDRDSPDRTAGAYEKTASDRTTRSVRGESSRARGSDDVEHDRFGRTIASLMAEYRALNREGRAWMLIRLVAAFLEIGTSSADDGKENT